MDTRTFKFTRLLAAGILATGVLAGTSCTTTYDAWGRPQQSVDPGVAIAGAAAAGLLGYALADNHHDHYHGGYYGPYHGPYRGPR